MWECKFCKGVSRYKKGDKYFCVDCNKNTQEPLENERDKQGENKMVKEKLTKEV